MGVKGVYVWVFSWSESERKGGGGNIRVKIRVFPTACSTPVDFENGSRTLEFKEKVLK